MSDESRWIRPCWTCGRPSEDWVIMTVHYLGKPPAGPVPICGDCQQRERDHRKEKGE